MNNEEHKEKGFTLIPIKLPQTKKNDNLPTPASRLIASVGASSFAGVSGTAFIIYFLLDHKPLATIPLALPLIMSTYYAHDAWNTFKNLKISEIFSAQNPNLTAHCQGPQYSKKRSFPKK